MIGRLLEFLVIRVLARLFPSRFRIIPRAQDGLPMLRQFNLFSLREEFPGHPFPWHFGAYLQSFCEGEVPERFHIHRWRRMLSFVLSGEFREARLGLPHTIPHAAPSVYQMDDTVIHRMTWAAPRTWTLYLMFGRNRQRLPGGWGYFNHTTAQDLNYRAWNEEIPPARRVPSFTLIRGGKV